MDLPGLVVLPELKCAVFAGNTADKQAFKKFLAQFENLVSWVKSSACKLQILRSYLSGYPAQVIEHLSVSDENNFVALDLLRSEFLHKKSNIYRNFVSRSQSGVWFGCSANFLYASESQPLGDEILLRFGFYGVGNKTCLPFLWFMGGPSDNPVTVGHVTVWEASFLSFWSRRSNWYDAYFSLCYVISTCIHITLRELAQHQTYSSVTSAIHHLAEKRKISYFGLALNSIQHLISPNQDDLSYSARTFISG